LNQVFGARLRITALRAERGPGIEFLEYITPPGGRPLPADAKANDIVFWNTHLVVDGTAGILGSLCGAGGRFVSSSPPRGEGDKRDACPALIVRDPDGHALQLNAANAAVARN
jgi:hypothetical protein